jgi:hypothetical protein
MTAISLVIEEAEYGQCECVEFELWMQKCVFDYGSESKEATALHLLF